MIRLLRQLRLLRMLGDGTYTPPVPPPDDCPMAWNGSCLQWEDEQVTWS